MSRTYRRKSVPVQYGKCSWSDDFLIYGGHTYDQCNTFHVSVTKVEDQFAPHVLREMNRFFSDSGTRKHFKYVKYLLNTRYREQVRNMLHHYLKEEDGELQIPTFRKFFPGYWFD